MYCLELVGLVLIFFSSNNNNDKPGVVANTCKPKAEKVKISGSWGTTANQPASLAYLAISRLVRADIIIIIIIEVDSP